ncbi:hypothetical protein NW767_013186 [Fusarium falciforme]|nr:hypothetical protein NW767_013186 [Fusarium falciforme]
MSNKDALEMTTSKAVSQQDREAGDVENVHLSEDVAVRFLASLDPAIKDVPISAKEARKVLWKIDLIVLPIIAGTVILSAVDKVGHCVRSLYRS